MDHQDNRQLMEAIAGMPPLLAQIVRRRFGIGGEAETLFEIGASMQLSRERIRQLEKKALGILRLKIDEIARVAA
jgi:RNA polymerase primary sigma factor